MTVKEGMKKRCGPSSSLWVTLIVTYELDSGKSEEGDSVTNCEYWWDETTITAEK